MRTSTLLVLSLIMAAGCGQNTGYIVKPVSLSEPLQESVVQTDKGLFVSDKIVVIDVDGLLMNQRDTGMFSHGENPVSLFVEKLDKAQDDQNVKAVVLRINSPGGGVTASDIMHRRLIEFRAARKIPVIAVIEDVGASGGYYIACGADTIIAHPTSVTGSIGVIVQTVSFAGTMAKIGIDAKAITSGRFKDMGSPFKPLDKDDAAIVQGIVDQFYKRFLGVVKDGRPKLTEEKIAQLADGRVYTGQQARENGLVDGLGYLEDVVSMAKSRANLSKAKVVMYHRPWGNRENIYSASPNLPAQINMVNINAPDLLDMSRPRFLYLWTGNN